MIIQALCELYDIFSNDENSIIAPQNFSKVSVKYEIVINKDGELIAVNSFNDEKEKKTVIPEMMVPEQTGRQSVGNPYFLCDNAQYIFGCTKNGNDFEISANGIKSFESMKNIHHEILADIENDEAKAVYNYFAGWDINKTFENPIMNELKALKSEVLSAGLLVFRLENNPDYVHNNQEIKNAWQKYCLEKQSEGNTGNCIATGEYGKIANVHPSIKGLGKIGGKALASLVTYNCSSFESYGKKQGENAPIIESAAFKYTTVLNEFISNEKYHVRFGDDTLLLFWAQTSDTKYNDIAFLLYGGDNKNEIVDDETIRSLNVYLSNVNSGIKNINSEFDPDVKFYIMAISVNSSRVVLRYFHQSTFGRFCETMKRHYADIDIVSIYGEANKKLLSAWSLLNSTKRDKKAGSDSKEKIHPLVTGVFTKAMTEGTMYPNLLFNLVMGRIRAGDVVSPERAAIIKAYINRKKRLTQVNEQTIKKEELSVSLDKSSRNTAYILGRLFSTLEEIQLKSLGYPSEAKTIKDSYFTSASATPKVVFPRLLKLSNYHMNNIEKGSYFLEQELNEIFDLLEDTKFPAQLTLEEQGTFVIGYYHQNCYRNDERRNYKENENKEAKTNE